MTTTRSCSPTIYPALMLALNAGMRNGKIRNLKRDQVDFKRQFLNVRKSKMEAGEGRTIPLNPALCQALQEHAEWYVLRFGRIGASSRSGARTGSIRLARLPRSRLLGPMPASGLASEDDFTIRDTLSLPGWLRAVLATRRSWISPATSHVRC